MEAYIQAKQDIAKNQTSEDTCILNYEDEVTRGMADKIDASVLFFSNIILENRIVVHRSLAEKLYLCLRYALHVSAKIQPEDPA